MSATFKKTMVLLGTPGAWHLRQTAKVFAEREALVGLWISDKNSTGIAPEKYRRAWPYHLAMTPFYRLAPQIWTERAFYFNFPFWRAWVKSQRWPDATVVQATMGFATEIFDRAEESGALKVVDCPNSHPTSYFGYWQRECDLWCPGEKVPIPQWVFARMNRELERADMILCPSIFVRDTMLANGVPEEKCFVNPFGVDISIFKPREIVPEKPRFITVGTICVRKGHQYLFRAFAELKKKMPQAELICVGDLKTDFRHEWPKWRDGITHIPHLKHQELATMLASCTAFVLPSLEEGFARVLSEAMAAGLPILASYESGATTMVQDGVEGIIIRSREPQHIAAAMLRVAEDSALSQKMGAAARKRGAISNTWQDYGDRLLEEYRRRLNP